jgi:tripartite-type tricarboxylate transporter receptor subunit TctC
MASEGTTPLIMTPAELKSFIDTETTKWVRLANEAGIQPE